MRVSDEHYRLSLISDIEKLITGKIFKIKFWKKISGSKNTNLQDIKKIKFEAILGLVKTTNYYLYSITHKYWPYSPP